MRERLVPHPSPDAGARGRALADRAADAEVLIGDLQARRVTQLGQATTSRPWGGRAVATDCDAVAQESHAPRRGFAVEIRDEGDDVRISHAIRMEEDLRRELGADALHPPSRRDDVDVVAPHLGIVGTEKHYGFRTVLEGR